MMSGIRAGRAFGLVGLAIAAALLIGPARAGAAKYAVAQCGWHIGNDADWSDSTGGQKFRPDSYCITPAGADPFDGTHMKSFTVDSAGTVSGTRFARWRWVAPPGTGIVNVRATWWHALHDGFEHRIGTGTGNGGFDVFAAASASDTVPREFAVGFTTPRPVLESRLLCARPEDRSCDLGPQSFSTVRALTITLQDDLAPQPSLAGELVQPAWQRGSRTLLFGATDAGSGLRFAETLVDGARAVLTEHACEKAMIGGEWRGTRMRPCATTVNGSQGIATTLFSDGPHSLQHCAEDFAGNRSCTPPRQLLIDNTAPAAPWQLALAGGEGWRRGNDFDAAWVNPGQGAASAIAAASYRIRGPEGYDSGVRMLARDGVAALPDLTVPAAGAYRLSVWLRDAAGNEDPANAATVPLLFDDVAPSVAFAAAQDPAQPETVKAPVADADSGPASGRILYRRSGTSGWVALPTELRASGAGGELVAHFPSDHLAPARYELRAEVSDAAGNEAASTSRADGTQMVLRAPLKENTTLFARLRSGRRGGDRLTVPFAARPWLLGRLIGADGAGIGGRELRVAVRPARGAFARARILSLRTGPHGGFRLRLGPGPSRRLRVAFAGSDSLAASASRPLQLRVRGALSFRVAAARLRTGDLLRMSGRVFTRGTAVPRRGKLVAIQYFERAARSWRPVMVVRTDHGGRFRARYRFRYISGSARIRLRAALPPEERWPYANGASPPALVRVSG
jgi:hypothetical protein